jgi:hypothetical protein
MPPEAETPITETPPSPTPTNSPEARLPTGELKSDLSTPTPEPGPTKSTEPTKAEPKSEDKPITGGTAPEKYEFKSLPDGFEITPEAEEFFKKNSFTQEQANNAVEYYVKKLEEAAKGPYEQWKSLQEEWVGKVKADPEYKGNLDNVRSTISKFLDQVGDPKIAEEMREAMDFTGAGNNPAFVKFMYRMAANFTEGAHVSGNGPSPHGQRAPGTSERPSAAKSMYPNLS